MSAPHDELRRARERQVRLATERFEESEEARQQNRRACEVNGTTVHDTLDQLEARAGRLIEGNETPVAAIVKVATSPPADKKLALERIIDASNELQSWTFLPRGARAARSVARITMIDAGRELPVGTGFLVSPRLLMTNNHVIPSPGAAQELVIEFGAELDIDNQPQVAARYELDPSGFFLTDDHLDVTLVHVRDDADDRPPGDIFGWNQLISQQGKIVTGEAVNIIGHPSGRLKEIAVRSNKLLLQLPDFLQYATDTEPGNSGSPVYNDQWEVVALHHAGVPKRDSEGRVLRKDGQPWQDGDGDDAVDWVANEGARTSVIIGFLAGQSLGPQQSRLLAEALDAGPGRGPKAPDEGLLVPPSTNGNAGAGRRAGGVPRAPAVRGRAGGAVNLVFLHGRSQQGKDPSRLRVEWTAGLNAGLTRAELLPLAPATAWFPYYGDRLATALLPRQAGPPRPDSSLAPVESVAPATGDPSRPVYEELVAQAAARAGMPTELAEDESLGADEGFAAIGSAVVGKLHRQLSWLSRRTGLDDAVIALVFADVAAYLGRPSVREAVLDAVRADWPPDGPVVLVSHSLGTVVAMDLIESLSGTADIALLVTAGSPLGLDGVYGRLLSGGPHPIARVRSWVNAWCQADAVAIGCPLRPMWGSQVSDVLTDNPVERAHSIAEYLADARVASPVGHALTGTPVPARG